MLDLVLRNGFVVTPDAVVRGGVSVENGRVVRAAPDIELGSAKRIIDLEGRLSFPDSLIPTCTLGWGEV